MQKGDQTALRGVYNSQPTCIGHSAERLARPPFHFDGFAVDEEQVAEVQHLAAQLETHPTAAGARSEGRQR